MNTPVRRIAIAVMAMVLILLANLTYVQVVQASFYRNHAGNQRVQLAEYGRERGQITAGGQLLATSVPTNDQLRYQRQYPKGAAFGPVTGYYGFPYGSSGVERAKDEVLNGSDDKLFVRRLSDLITGRDPRGGNVVLTLDPAAQQVAYDALVSRHYPDGSSYRGAVVAMAPKTGEILAMASTPTFDPTLLASHSVEAQQQAWAKINAADPPILTNRALDQTYPPGSTFKLVDTAAALQNGVTPDTQLTSAPQITLAGTSTTLENFGGQKCGGGATVSLRDAFRFSCNTAFAEMVRGIGVDPLREQAAKFGIGEADVTVPMPVAASSIGDIVDVPSLQQSAIGQRDVRLTPMQNAMIVATIANGGIRMTPYLVKELQASDLSTVDTTEPNEAGRAIPASVAKTLTDLMRGSEDNTAGGGKIPGVAIASKTGTAEHGTSPKTTPPHNWYVAFAPADNPVVAVAVLVEDGGDRGLQGTGGAVAAPIGRAVIAAILRGRR